jgi:capsid protein
MAYNQSDFESVQAARLALARGERVFSVIIGEITTQYHLTDDASLRVLELDRLGKRVAYWAYRAHPGESFIFDQGSGERIRIPASEMLHIFRPLRPGQARGKPWLTSIILRLHELVREKGAAMLPLS